MRAIGLMVALAALIAGCAGAAQRGAGPGARSASEPTILDAQACGNACFEPSVTALPDGRLALLGANLTILDPVNGTQRVTQRPPLPSGAPSGAKVFGDGIVQTSPDGLLYDSDLVNSNGRFVGVMVAATADEGATWSVDSFLPALPGDVPESAADRQWIGFAGNGRLYVSWAEQFFPPAAPLGLGAATGVWVARSDDGGRTFATPVRAVPYESRFAYGKAGPPVVDSAGRVSLPYWVDGCVPVACPGTPTISSSALHLAVSTDEGASWTQLPVADADGSGFPSAAVAPGDAWVVGYWDGSATRVTVSTDHGATWSAPVADGSAAGGYAGPALLPRADGTLDLLTYDVGSSGGGCALTLAHGPLGGPPAAVTRLASNLTGLYNRPCPSDYASLTRLPGDRLAATWADADRGADVVWVGRAP
jgi:hypothetical protein